MRSVFGKLDVESRTVDLTMDAANLEGVEVAFTWLRKARNWLIDQERRDAGGSRWEFTRGVTPTAQYWRGSAKWGHEVPLILVGIAKARECTACHNKLQPRDRAWRQRPHAYTGASAARFCMPCVGRGHAPRPPKLVVLRGGKETRR